MEGGQDVPGGGYRIALLSGQSEETAEIILSHHERWDGSGYPSGLNGEQIPLLARIVSIVDAYDAMTSTRPYRRAMDSNQAIRELKRSSGSQFDPELVKPFAELMSGNALGAAGE